MSKLTDERIDELLSEWLYVAPGRTYEEHRPFARAIEAAATKPLLQRIAELEQRNSDLHEDVQRFKKHALNEKAARLELERQLEQARKDAERLDWMIFYSASLNHGNDGEYCRVVWRDHEFGEQATRLFGDSREAIDAAMQKGQS